MELGFEGGRKESGRWYVYDWTNMALDEGVTALYDTKKEAKKKARGMAQQAADKLNRPVTISILTQKNRHQRTETIEPSA